MELINLFLLIFLAFSSTADAAECETGWFQYKDELCIQSFPNFLTYEEAKTFCSSQGDEISKSSLVIVKEEELQHLLANYTQDVFDNIWLGGKYDNGSAQFLWDDGTPLTFTNWQDGYPTNVTEPEHCIELRPQNSKESLMVDGKWADVVCQKRNMVMCQRTLSWSLQDAIHEIIKMRKQLETTQNSLETTQNKLDTTIDILEDVSSRVVPVGSIYIEYYNQPNPSSLWPSLEWEDISGTYAGLFFRTSGGGSASWGSTQSECAPRITETQFKDNSGGSLPSTGSIPSNGFSEYFLVGHHVSTDWDHYLGMRFLTQGCEVRPNNQAVRIWKRIA